jgi:hypothetical protein
MDDTRALRINIAAALGVVSNTFLVVVGRQPAAATMPTTSQFSHMV